MIINDDPQGSEQWFKTRCGIPSASNFDKIITTKGVPSKSALKYCYTLAGERITGKKEDTFQSYAMLQGIEREAESRRVYAEKHNVYMQQVGFCTSDDGKYGVSPDALIGGVIPWETKGPTLAVHVEYLLGKKLPTKYFQQCQGALFISGADHGIFTSYYTDMPMLEVVVEPDIPFHRALYSELLRFCDDLDKLTEQLRKG